MTDPVQQGQVDMDIFMKELRRQNEEMLATHKAQLEAQFREQMEVALSSLRPPPKGSQGQGLSSTEFFKGRTPLRPGAVDEETERFHKSAMSTATAPKYTVYDGNRKVTLRASVEGREISTMPISVNTKGPSMGEVSSSGTAAGAGGKKSRGKLPGVGEPGGPPLPSQFANTPYADPVWKVDKKKKKKYAELTEEDEAALANIDEDGNQIFNATDMDQIYGQTAKEKAAEERKQLIAMQKRAEEIKLRGERKPAAYSELGDVTGYLLRKSQFLVKDTNKKLKRKKKPSTSSVSGPSPGTLPNIDRGMIPSLQSTGTVLGASRPGTGATNESEYEDGNEEDYEEEGKDGIGSGTGDSVSLPPLSGQTGTQGGEGRARYEVVEIGGGDGDGEKYEEYEEEEEEEEEEPDDWLHPDLKGKRVVPPRTATIRTRREGGEGEDDEEVEVVETVEMDAPDTFDPIGWENQIARHILSVYASTKYSENEKGSKVLLNYADATKAVSAADIKRELDRDPLEGSYADRVQSWEEEGREGQRQDEQEGEGEGEGEGDEEEEEYDEEEEGKDEYDYRPQKGGNYKFTLSGMDRSKMMTPGYVLPKGFLSSVDRSGKGGHRKTVGATSEIRRKHKKRSIYDKDENANKFRIETKLLTGDGREIIVRGLPKCYSIWFASTGDIYSDWTLLPGGEKLQAQLAVMLERRRYYEYLGIVETLLDVEWAAALEREGGSEGVLFSLSKAATMKTYYQDRSPTKRMNEDAEPEDVRDRTIEDDEAGIGSFRIPEKDEIETGKRVVRMALDPNPTIKRSESHLSLLQLVVLWRQLVVTGNAFACLCLNEKRNELAMSIMQRAKAWAGRKDILPKDVIQELVGYVSDAMGFYYFRCRKAAAALSEVRRAEKLLEKSRAYDAVAIARLHMAAVLCQQGAFRESHKVIYSVIAMVEEGRLSFDEANPKQLCIVAVAYHNLAVVQLKLSMGDLACKNSMNARKIARLCLSYSNRWLHVFQYTHECALDDAKFNLEVQQKEGHMDKRQLKIMKELTEAMFESKLN